MSKLIDFWNRLFSQGRFLSSPRRLLLLLAVVGIVLTGYWLFSSASAPELVYLTDRPLSTSQLAKANACLSQWDQTYQIRDSYILVEPARRTDLLARMDFLAEVPEIETPSHDGLLKGGIFLSESERRQRWNLRLEEALAAQIRSFKGLRAARVFLAGPVKVGLSPGSTCATASVIVSTDDDQPLELELAQAIRQTIAGTISGLTPENVNVIDAGSGCYVPTFSQYAAGSSEALQSVGTISYLSNLINLSRRAQRLESQWEQKIRSKFSHIPETVVSVHINPRSLLAPAQAAKDQAAPLLSDTAEPEISVSVNIPRSYLLSLYSPPTDRAAGSLQPDFEMIAGEQIAKIAAGVRAIIGRPTSSHVHVDWYYDNPPAVASALTDGTGSASSLLSRWLQPAYIGAVIAIVSLLTLLIVFVRRLFSSHHDQRAIALARLASDNHYLNYTPAQQPSAPRELALESISYRGPAGIEVSAFEELLRLDDATLRGLLARTEPQIVALALRTASDKLRRRILADLPFERRQAVHDHPDFLGPVRLSDIEAAQQEMVDLLEISDHADSELVGSAGASAT